MAAPRKKFNRLSILIVILVLWNTNAISQTNYLYKRISVSFSDIPLKKGLDIISEAGGFTFSYNSKNFDEQRLVSLHVNNKPVARSINQLFDNTVRFKLVGSHIILSKKNQTKEIISDNIPNNYIITGYIINSRTGEKIKEATVYEIDGRVVALSNSEGFYSLTLPAEKSTLGLSYSKAGFLDTVIMVQPIHKNSFDISLHPRITPIQKLETKHVKLENIHSRPVVDILVPKESKIISDNLIIHDRKLAQISFIPYIGTNRKLSGSVDNTFSFNVLAGYSGGVNGFEIGGMLNIVRRDVRGSQLSGVANIVGGNTNPFQLAGMFNLNSGSVTGTQIAGMSNVVLDTLNGVQLAGFNNTLHGYMNGVQISGFNNVTTQNVDGVQLTGFINVAVKDVKLGQVGGFANYCDNVDGGQIAGFANTAKGDVNWGQIAGFGNYGKSVNGTQLAGFINISAEEVEGGQLAGGFNIGKTGGKFQLSGYGNIAKEEMNGIQLAGYFNYAKKVNGYQIAIFNISDTIESGLPIGIFSFVKKGLHRFEVSANDVFYTSIAYKMGLEKLYNSIRVGYDYNNNIAVGYGIGTQRNISNKVKLNLELSSDLIIKKNSVDVDLSSGLSFENSSFNLTGTINKINTNLDFFISDQVSVFIGPSLNVSVISMDNNTKSFQNFAPYSFYSETISNTQIKMWVGGNLGLSFTL